MVVGEVTHRYPYHLPLIGDTAVNIIGHVEVSVDHARGCLQVRSDDKVADVTLHREGEGSVAVGVHHLREMKEETAPAIGGESPNGLLAREGITISTE
jgi:hypothetical protein